MKFSCLTILAFIGSAACGEITQLTAKSSDSSPAISRVPTLNLEAIKNLRNEKSLEGFNFVKGWDNQVSGTGNAVIGKEQNAYGINNYLEGQRNSIRGIGNIGIGDDLSVLGVNNLAYGSKNKI